MTAQIRTWRDWDDARIFLALARAGSLSGAARRLGVNHTTIARRLANLEAALGGEPLLERLSDGFVLTAAGQAALAEAERMEVAAERFRRATEASEAIAGAVRVSSIASFAERVLAAPLADLSVAYPGLQLELVSEDRNVQFARGEADVAVRFGRPADDAALARQLGTVGYHLYAAPAYLAAKPLDARRTIGFSAAMEAAVPAAARLHELARGAGYAMRCNTQAAQAAAAAAGAGLALLPTYLGDAYPGLVRAEPAAAPAWSRPIWLVVREDARRVARIRRVADAIAEAIAARAAALRA